MTSKRQRTSGSQRSCPNSNQRAKEDTPQGYNPEFEQLSSKKLGRPSNSKGETHAPTPDSIKEVLLASLEQYFHGQFSDFDAICRRWIMGEWRETRLNLQSRLTKINYLSPTLVFESFAAVEREVRVEWQKNHLLKGFTYLWSHSFLKHTFATLEEANNFYEGFCQTFANVSLALFKVCLAPMEDKEVDVRGKLLRSTAVSVVTELKQWREIHASKLEPFFLSECTSFSQNFNVEGLEVNPRVLDVNSPRHTFAKTKSSLTFLADSLTLDDATTHLLAFRSNLIKEIEESIQLNGHSRVGKHLTVEKDDVLGCIMYTLVAHKLDSIGCFLAYLSFLLGKDIDSVLRGRKVDCFRADLQAAYWYVSQPVIRLDYSMKAVSL